VLKGNLTISRPSGGRHDDRACISITIRDATSRIDFATIEVPLALFAEALTGLSEVEGSLTVRGLRNVGKVRDSQAITFVLTDEYMTKYGLQSYDRAGIRAHLEHDPEGRFHEEGWELSTYLGTHHSIAPNSPDGIRVNTSRVRYVERTTP
jgi:hypothetical protein